MFFKRRPRFFRRGRHRRWRRRGNTHPYHLTLADSPPGRWVRMVGFLPEIAPDQKDRLYAYGLVPGHRVCVLQHAPVTIIKIDHTELALERELARLVRVQPD